MRRFVWLLLVVFILFALTGCTFNTFVVGKNGMRVKAGEWLGKNDNDGEWYET